MSVCMLRVRAPCASSVCILSRRRFVQVLGSGNAVRYEELVADPEPIVRGMLEHIGVPFDERCLAFHESSRAIHTASLDQVRRPIYTSSTERWRRYGPGTGPLIDALTRHGVIRG